MKTNRILYVALMFLSVGNAQASQGSEVNGNCRRNYYHNLGSSFYMYVTCYEDETFHNVISSKTISFSFEEQRKSEYAIDFTTNEVYKVKNPNERYSIDSVSRSEYGYENGVSYSNDMNVTRDSEGNIISQTERISTYPQGHAYDGTSPLSQYLLKTEYDENGNKMYEVKYDTSEGKKSLCNSDSNQGWWNFNTSSGYYLYPLGTKGKTVSVSESYYTYDDEGRVLSKDGTSCSVDAEGNFYDDNCQSISSCTPVLSEIYTYGSNGSCEMTNLLEGYSRACNEDSAQQQRRRIYTVQEATEAVQGNNNKNRFILRYR